MKKLEENAGFALRAAKCSVISVMNANESCVTAAGPSGRSWALAGWFDGVEWLTGFDALLLADGMLL